MIVPLNAINVSIDVMVVDDTGLPITGLIASTFPPLFWCLSGPNSDVAFPTLSDLATLTTAWVAGGVKERVGGVYRVDCPNDMMTIQGVIRIIGEAVGQHVLFPVIEVDVQVNNNLAITTIVTPIISTVNPGQVSSNDLVAYHHASFNFVFTILDNLARPVDLSGKSITFNVFDPAENIVFAISDCPITGTSNNIVTVSSTDVNTGTTGKWNFVLWNETDDIVLSIGTLSIRPAAGT